MLVYLDNGENIKSHPNENFGRELLELFTMGVGNYTRARCARGRARVYWLDQRRAGVQVRRCSSTTSARRRFSDAPERSNGEDIIDTILAQPVTGEFVAGKLYRLLRAGGHLERRQSRTRTYVPRERLSDEAAAASGCCCRRTSTALRRSRLRSRARCIWSSRPTGRWACVTCRRFRTSVA